MAKIDWKALVVGIVVLFITQFIVSRFIFQEFISWGIGVIAMIVTYNYIKYGKFGRFDTVR
jgi:FtsH-binding integral membrane protein